MKRDNKISVILRPYTEAMPDILNYQIVTKAIICIWLFLLGRLFQILLLGLASLFIYVAFDLNSKIVLSRNLITGRKATLEDSIREGFLSIGKMINAEGILVVLYIALIAPILGIGISISATEKLYIPTFISSVIESSVLYSALAGIAVLVFLSAGV
ncbi:MAG: glycerophosphoryl diester phosphodiesterase membrane domain-containing protein [Mogibacterium sp.]|nr:glycerophosphoryl diester phosphodiesterase membrane domain-containing protein [Mogibacterium sp.]